MYAVLLRVAGDDIVHPRLEEPSKRDHHRRFTAPPSAPPGQTSL
jgi:hypothetical protein